MAKDLPKIPEFDVREILKPGVDLTQDIRSTGPNQFDIIQQMEDLLRPRSEIRPFMDRLHTFFLEEAKRPLAESWASEEGLAEIYEVWREFVSHELSWRHTYWSDLHLLDKVLWPQRIKPLLANNPALAAWSRRFATGSLTAFKFVQNVHNGRLAEAMCMAHCNGWDVFGRFGNVELRDSVVSSCLGEECFMMARDRCRFFQRYLPRAEQVLYLGGGCDPTLRMHGYVVPERQQIRLCDKMDCRHALETLMGAKLADCHIDFQVSDLRQVLANPAASESYDLIIASGLMSYCRNELDVLLPQVRRALRPGGVFAFDLQVQMLDYLYVTVVHHWPGKDMVLEKDCQEATRDMSEAAERCGFTEFESWYDWQCQSAICFAMHK